MGLRIKRMTPRGFFTVRAKSMLGFFVLRHRLKELAFEGWGFGSCGEPAAKFNRLVDSRFQTIPTTFRLGPILIRGVRTLGSGLRRLVGKISAPELHEHVLHEGPMYGQLLGLPMRCGSFFDRVVLYLSRGIRSWHTNCVPVFF